MILCTIPYGMFVQSPKKIFVFSGVQVRVQINPSYNALCTINCKISDICGVQVRVKIAMRTMTINIVSSWQYLE